MLKALIAPSTANIVNSLMDFVKAIEDEQGIEAKKNFREMQPGGLYKTYVDTQDLFAATAYTPKVTVKKGVAEFMQWYRKLYKKYPSIGGY